MRIIEPYVTLESKITQKEALDLIESAGRVCYKSEDKINGDSAEKFIKGILSRGHESVIEHVSITVRVVCDRGVTHEIVRHRIASYSQESTRYCNYTSDKFSKEITVIRPIFWNKGSSQFNAWQKGMEECEKAYFSLINAGASPQEARSVLPNSLKTEIFITMNFREWRHFFSLRCSKAAHPQMQQIANMIFDLFKEKYPLFIQDIMVD
ncbi:FAD-dependent thymidylate synthase [Ruminococcus flavefaciens]|uniref:FAD-dependent thymidylate synthase n=1 Tax=Ruminococcus flavefaciens TaxID=1265 RepID=A0A315XVP6_RUMFL|nr:FAD-dependent thymidylate synthase [Ruminococcus flavefaciens]PWJ10257.1 thymidylate synthase (FAD) [Ruminococcus flavefaciens]SSA51997.1 thymidylate synthase (FAD) [Ruminococcus flavefaciens]